MQPSDIIQVIGIVSAMLIGIISIIISVITLRQNSKMIEESSRPVISIYCTSTNFGIQQRYLVIKNFGQTQATISKFDYDYNFVVNQAYAVKNSDTDWLKNLVTTSLSPGQSKICAINSKNINMPVTFTYEYKTSTKTYKDKITINLNAGDMLTSKSNGVNGDTLGVISYTLQEMLQKDL